MKKFTLSLLTVLLGMSMVWAQNPIVHWRFANPVTYEELGNCVFEFDVELSCDMAGTFHSDMQVYFNYNDLAFGQNIVSNANVTQERLELLLGDVGGTDKYIIYGPQDNKPNRYAILTEKVFPIANPTFMNEVPMLPTYGGFFKFKIVVQNQGELAGIEFVPEDAGVGIMNGGQYYLDAAHPAPTKYGDPPNYAGMYENDLLTASTSCIPCPPVAVWTGAVDNDWNIPGNWDVGAVPCITTDVTIPAGLTNYPICYNAGECNNIYFESNTAGTATILDNGILTVAGTATYERYYSTVVGGLFTDDFEDGNVTEYCQTTGFSASQDVAHGGTWSGKLEGGGSHYSGARICMTDETPEYVSFWTYPTTATAFTNYFVLSDGPSGGGNGYQAVFFYAYNNATFRIIGATTHTYPYSANNWYHVEFMNIDWANQVMDVYIDGNLVVAGMGFRGASAFNLDNIDLYHFSTGQLGYYDDIYVGASGGGGGGAAWHLTSSPIADGLSGIYLGQYLQSYDETNMAWTDIIPVDIPLIPMQGYGFWATGGNTAYYTGTLNTGPYSAQMTADNAFGWNLLGNPYPSSIDWDMVTIPAYMNGAVYYLDAQSGNYVSYNGGMGGGSSYVPPVQGFFVSATGAGPLSFDNSVRTHMEGSNYYKNELSNSIELIASGNGFSDATYIRFDENATAGFDGEYDAYKLFGLEYNNLLPQVYTTGGDKLSINVLPEVNAIPVSFRAGIDGQYTISAGEVNDIETMYLQDLVTGQITVLDEESYTFTYKAGDDDGRFMLYLTPFGEEEGSVNIYSYADDIFVILPEDVHGDIYIYNMTGQLVSTHPTNGTFNQIGMNQGGNYIVKLMTNQGVETQVVNVR